MNREELVEHLLEHVSCVDAADERAHAEKVADDVIRAREATERVRALQTFLGWDDMLPEIP